MSENSLWKDLRGGLSGRAHLCRLESHATAAGFPDVDYCIDGVTGQLELKYAEYPDIPEVRTTQVSWFRFRTNHGGYPLILAKLVRGENVYYCLYPGSRIKRLADAPDFETWMKLAQHIMVDQIDWKLLILFMRSPVAIY